MKNKIYILSILGILYLLGPISVNALTGSATLTCDKDTLKNGETTTCSITGNVQGGNISSLSAKISLSNNLELGDVTTSNLWQGNGGQGNILLYTSPAIPAGNFEIGTFNIKAKASTGTGTIKIEKIYYYDDEEYAEFPIVTVQKSISITTDPTPSDLTISVSGANLGFSKDITTYNVTIDAPTTTIQATTTDSNTTIEGDVGVKNLNYGINTFKVSARTQAGETKVYTINITRPKGESGNNNIKQLVLGKVQLDFNPNITEYIVTVENNITTIKVNATLEDSKASFVDGFGNREVELKEGANKILIKIQAENKTEKTYTITINRKALDKPNNPTNPDNPTDSDNPTKPDSNNPNNPDKNENSSSTNQQQEIKNPATGDMNIYLVIFIFILASIGGYIGYQKYRKQSK